MKILYVAHSLNLSGASIHNITLGKELIIRGIEVAIVVRETCEGTPLGKEYFEQSGFKVYKSDLPLSTYKNFLALRNQSSEFKKVIKDFNPDIVHVQAPTLTPFCVFCIKSLKIPVLSTFNIEAIGPVKGLAGKIINTFSPNYMGCKVFSISSEMANLLVHRIGFQKSKIEALNLSVDSDKFHFPSQEEKDEAKKLFNLESKSIVVSIAAILDERKGQKYAIHAIHSLIKKGIDIKLVCAGRDAGDYHNLKRLVKELKLQNSVFFPGNVDPLNLYWASDISILPSIKEGFGLVVIEAMLSGAIVARTPTAGCNDQIIDGETGFVFDTSSSESIVDTIQLILNRQHDWPAIRVSAEKHARTNFTVKKMADITIKAYKDCLA